MQCAQNLGPWADLHTAESLARHEGRDGDGRRTTLGDILLTNLSCRSRSGRAETRIESAGREATLLPPATKEGRHLWPEVQWRRRSTENAQRGNSALQSLRLGSRGCKARRAGGSATFRGAEGRAGSAGPSMVQRKIVGSPSEEAGGALKLGRKPNISQRPAAGPSSAKPAYSPSGRSTQEQASRNKRVCLFRMLVRRRRAGRQGGAGRQRLCPPQRCRSLLTGAAAQSRSRSWAGWCRASHNPP